MVLIAILTALGAAMVFGVSSVAEQRGAKHVETRRALSPRILLDLVRQPLWVAAIGGTLMGFTLQVVAPGLWPARPRTAHSGVRPDIRGPYRRPPATGVDPKLLLGVATCVIGIGGFLAIARPSDGTTNVGFFVILPLAAALAAGVGGCLAVARRNETA